MKLSKGIFILLSSVILLLQTDLVAQVSRGKVLEGLKIKSKILKKDVRYTIYFPFDYETSNRYYPVVYLLHGYTDNDMGWIQFGEANILADEAIAHNKIPPMILAMPDAGVSWYINNYDNSVRYEDFFIQEFIPFIESNYRIRTEKRYRAVSGLSMGGYGSLIYALKHPDLFAACVAFSAAIYSQEEIIHFPDDRWKRIVSIRFHLSSGKRIVSIHFPDDRWKRIDTILYGPDLKGEKRLTEHLLSNNPIHIVKNSDQENLKSVRFYIDCGDDDFLYKGNALFHILLRDLNIPHEFRVRNGGHQWSYWRSGLIPGLQFIGESFHQP